MSIDERAVEPVQERCEECGTPLTPRELQLALERGGPALCTVHAAESEPGLEDPALTEEP